MSNLPSKKRTDFDEYTPPAKLRMFVQVLFSDGVNGNREEAARRLGVDKGVFYYALNNKPEFRKWFSQYCDNFLAEKEDFVAANLLKNIKNGSDAAIRTYYQIRGKLKNDSNVDARSIHIGDKNETNVTNIHDNRTVVGSIEKLNPEQRQKLRKALEDSGLLKGSM